MWQSTKAAGKGFQVRDAPFDTVKELIVGRNNKGEGLPASKPGSQIPSAVSCKS